MNRSPSTDTSQTGTARLRVGTSGWSYPHWVGPFYPSDTSAADRLAYYAGKLDTVEINNSFYRAVEIDTLRSWRSSVAEDFLFSYKANRYITHMKKLKDPSEPIRKLSNGVRALGENQGPVLFQLPPKWTCNARRLREFLAALPQDHLYAFEFRDESWFNDEVYSLLSDSGAAFCIYDLQGRRSPREVTAPFVYMRLHGPANAAYQGRYSLSDLAGWYGAIHSWLAAGRDVYCYFDNDENGYAPLNAMELVAMSS